MNEKAATVILLILIGVSFLLMPLSTVTGQLGVNIYLVTPEEEGVAGERVNLQGSIDTTNGKYQIWFDEELVLTNYSEGYYVNANFTIPALSEGDHVITLRDVTTNGNVTRDFALVLAYYIEAVLPSSPAQLQEGDDVVLNVTIAGVQPSTTNYANVTVELPEPLSTIYYRIVSLVASSDETVATALVTFPSSSFEPEGSLTSYTGSYKVYFNETDSLAENDFFVGFTDSSQYHRGQTLTTHAVDYQAGESAMISIESSTGASVDSETVTASSEGIFEFSWMIPSDVPIGEYTITIEADTTDKLIPDSQAFTVPGYMIKVNTSNLAGETVAAIVVEGFDQAAGKTYDGTSNSIGVASLKLEKGNHLLTAFWNDVKVGELNVSITGAASFDLKCALTNLEIIVQNENGNSMPFVALDITYQYVTTKTSSSKTGFASGATDLSGTYIMNSVLPGISYTINASLYDVVFNANNKTVTNLPVQPVSKVVIVCPSQTLTLGIIDYNEEEIPNARIELVEITNGLFKGAETGASGRVTVEVTFGRYRLRVYKDEILLNSTTVEVFSDAQREICCCLYNIDVSVTVVDYFNQPISGMNVVLQRAGVDPWLATTQADGAAIFSNVIGGNMQIIAYPEGAENSYEAFSTHIEGSKAVEIKLAKYVLLGPFLFESSALATFIVILLAIVLFVSIEVYRRKRANSGNSES